MQKDIEYNPGEKFGFQKPPESPSQLSTQDDTIPPFDIWSQFRADYNK